MKSAMKRRLSKLEASVCDRGQKFGIVCIEPGETEAEAFARKGIERGQCSTLFVMDLRAGETTVEDRK